MFMEWVSVTSIRSTRQLSAPCWCFRYGVRLLFGAVILFYPLRGVDAVFVAAHPGGRAGGPPP